MLPVLASVGGSLLGGVLGGIFGGADREAAESAQAQAEAIINAVGAGPDLARQIYHNSFQQAGLMTPEVEQAINTEMDKKLELEEKPGIREEQERGLQALKQLSRTGLGIEDQAAFNKLRRQAGADQQAKQAQLLQGMAQRGMGGSGQELAMQIAASQQGAESEAEAADRIAAQAAEARRGALKDVFAGSSQMRQTDLDVAAKNMETERLRREFLAQNALGRQQRNVGTLNQAQLENLQRQQHVSDANINQANAELLRQRQAEQQMYQNKMALAQLQAGAKMNKANQLRGQAQATQQAWTGMGSSLGGAIGGYLQHEADKDWASGLANKANPTDYSTAAIPSSDSFKMPNFGSSPKQKYHLNSGGRIEGEAKHDGDHPENDTVQAHLSPGEIVIPRSFAKHPEAAKAFIESLFSKEDSEE